MSTGIKTLLCLPPEAKQRAELKKLYFMAFKLATIEAFELWLGLWGIEKGRKMLLSIIAAQ